MKIAIYIRVSRGDLNPANQSQQLVEYANRQGWAYQIFEEIESTRKSRPVKADLMQRLRRREFDGVLIWKLDRWARSLQELIMEVAELINKKVHFIVLTTPIDTTSPQGMLMLQILGAFAEFEREIIRERTIAGLERVRAQGKKLGRPSSSGRVYVKPSRAQVSELLAQGLSYKKMASKLDTSKYWIETVVREINKREPYRWGDYASKP